jgi:hypothetical protein
LALITFLPLASASWSLETRPLSSLGTRPNDEVALLVRLASAAEFLLALMFSLTTMVRMSPTWRGRRSSNSACAPKAVR